MTRGDDLPAMMPEPPSPRPDRRRQAIEEALRRFDAGGEPMRAPRGTPAHTPVRAFLARPQVAAFATVLLVALVSSPLWLSGFEPRAHHGSPQTPVRAATGAQLARPLAEAGAAPAPVARNAPAIVPIAPAESAPAAKDNGLIGLPSAPPPGAFADARSAAPPPPAVVAPPVPAPIAGAPAAKAERIDQRAALASPPPVQAANEPSDQNDIVVTGARVERPERDTFGRAVNLDRSPIVHLPPNDDAWNACTVLDPRKSLQACRDLLDPGQPGGIGRAAAYISEGLTAAWKRDLGGAIKAFDRAIATFPQSSFAYLNRGLAYQRKGDDDRALADFTAAIARDPDSASAYYHRSLLLRAKGETGRADADAERARQIDPRNAGVLRQPKSP